MPTGQAADGGTQNGVLERPPIETFAIDFEMPMTVANCLVGRTEAETVQNIKDMRAYLSTVITKFEHYLDGEYL